MSELSTPPESFFSIRAFDAARQAGAVAIEYNVEAIAGMDEFLKHAGARGLQTPPEYVDFAHFWTGGRTPADWDTHFYKARMDARYLLGSQLGAPTHEAAATAKADIVARGRSIVELPTSDYRKPLAGALARALIAPPPEEAQMAASPVSWGRQIRQALTLGGLMDAFTPDFSNSGNPKLETEAAKRYANAIILKTR